MINLNHIYYIPGLKGLYGVMNTTRAGIIVCSVETGQRVTVFNSSKIGCLSAMTVETKSGKISLPDVFCKMKVLGETIAPDAEPQELHAYFRTLMPDYNEKLTRASDISKIIKWFTILDGFLDFSNSERTA